MLCLPTRGCMEPTLTPPWPATEDAPRVNERPEWRWPTFQGTAFRVTSVLGFSVEQEGWLSLEVDVVKWYTWAVEKKGSSATSLNGLLEKGLTSLSGSVLSGAAPPRAPRNSHAKKHLAAVLPLATAFLQGDIANVNGSASTPVLVLEDATQRLVLRVGDRRATHACWLALATARLLAKKLAAERRVTRRAASESSSTTYEEEDEARTDEDDDDDDDDAASSSSDAASSSQAQEDAYPRARSLSSETLAPDEEEEEETPRTRSRNEKVVDVSQSSAARQAYEQVLRLIIRPPRAQYSMAALGPKRFTFLGRVVIRRDFSVMNRRGLRVHASSWTPYWAAGPGDTKSPLEKSPLDAALNRRHSVAHDDDDDDDDKKETSQGTLIYLHGNASCRVESLCALSTCVSLGLSLCAVDCAGSGKSDGDYVSLGHYESEDVAAVVAHLRRHNVLDFRYGLWGRSMGAVTALLYACRQAPDAACLVVDSPFTSLERLCKDLVRKATDRVPRAAVAVALRQVRTSVKYRSGFDLKDCDALARVPSCVAPALFVHGLEDDFIVSDHTDEIYASYGGSVKCLLKPAGNHNATRPSTVFFGIERFLKRHLPCRPLSRTQVAAMSPTYTLAQTTKARWQDSDEADFTLDDLKTSRGCDNVYVLPPWKFPLGPAGHDPTAPRYRSKLSSYAQRLTEDDDEFVSGMSDARQRQTHADVEALFGSGGRSSPP